MCVCVNILRIVDTMEGNVLPIPATAPTMSVVSAPAINPSQMAVTGPVTIQSTYLFGRHEMSSIELKQCNVASAAEQGRADSL